MVAIGFGLILLAVIFVALVIVVLGFLFLKKRDSQPKMEGGMRNTSIKVLSIISLVLSLSALVLTILEFIFNWLIFVWFPVISMFILGVIFSVISFIKYKRSKTKEGKILVIVSLIISGLLLLGVFGFILLILIAFSRGM